VKAQKYECGPVIHSGGKGKFLVLKQNIALRLGNVSV
jgi:hypothetical protein